MFTLCSVLDDGRGALVGGQMPDDRDQIGALASAQRGGRWSLRMHRIVGKMTTFDDFLTTFDDF